MSSSAPPAPPALPPPKPNLSYMTGYEHFLQNIKPRIKVIHPGFDTMDVSIRSAELWNSLAPCEKMYWDKVASDSWDKYTSDIMHVVNADPQKYALYEKMPNVDYCRYCKCATPHYFTTRGFTAEGFSGQGATAQRAMAQGATAQGYSGQGATAQGYSGQGATAQGYSGQGVTVQRAMAQGYSGQGVTVQRAMAQGATAHGYSGQGATPQGYSAQSVTSQGYSGQGGTAAKGYGVQGVVGAQEYRAPDGEMAATSGSSQSGRNVYPTYKVDMEAGTSYKSYLYFGDATKPEVRRFFLCDLESYKFEPLETMIRDIYNLKSQKFSIAWKDEDGDEVVMSSDAEVRTMLSEGQDGVIKLVVRCENDATAQTFPAAKEEPAAKEAHAAKEAPSVTASTANNQGDIPGNLPKAVVCDGCGHFVVGHRYKCISCDNFDLCGKCETEGKHSHHCVVRMPCPNNMSVQLLKATIKKSRRYLKSVTSTVIEENKKLRRERKHCAEPNTQGKQDPQPRTSITWMEIVNKYMDEFANVAGNMAYYPRRERATTEAATSTEPRSGETDMNIPTDAQNPWHLDPIDYSRYQNARKFLRDYNLGETKNCAVKFFGSLDPSHAFAPEMDMKKGASNLTQDEKDIAEAGPAPRQEAMNPETNPEPQEFPKTYQGVAKPELAPTQAALSDSVEITITGQGTPESKEIHVKPGDISELSNAVNKCEVSSNASSCSEGNGYEKAEGWTVVDADNLLKDENPEASANVEDGPMEDQAPVRQHAPLYPPLNAATAVFNPNASDVAPASVTAAPASSSAAPSTAAKHDKTAAKKATAAAAAIAEDLRAQIAPHVEAALQHMEIMGFSNESGWLTQLLDNHDGNIAAVLDLIAPIKGSDAPSAPNAPNARPK